MPAPKFLSDNVFLRLNLTLADLSCLSAISGPTTMRPENAPLLVGVEAVRERNAPTNSPQIATRYNLVFPGSGFMRVSVKVDESTPSIAQATIDKYGGAIRVNIEDFVSGSFETDDGGARPYFKAARITPVQTQAQPSK